MFERAEQLRVESPHPCQVFGVDSVALALVLVDQPKLARVRHEHFVTEPFEQTTYPRRVHPCFDGNPLRRCRLEVQFDRSGRCCYTSFRHNRTISVQSAVVAEPITQVDADRHDAHPIDPFLQRCCCPRLRCRHLDRLLHGQSPFFFVP